MKASDRGLYARSLRDPEGFWGEAAEAIDWIEKPKKIFDKAAGIYGRWFVGGVCNTCFNAVDRHVKAGRGPALLRALGFPFRRDPTS